MKDRPVWQEEHGPRYGNQRKQVAIIKVKERRADKKKSKEEFRRELDSTRAEMFAPRLEVRGPAGDW